MLPQVDASRLSVENRVRLEQFSRRFCEGELRRRYGLGHLLYACHAAFPLVLSPDLANLLWVNFNCYSYSDSSTGKIDPVAVSDFLLSPLCRQIGHKQYEVYPEVRSYLLHLLRDGVLFYRYGIELNGQERLRELAEFLLQYLTLKKGRNAYEGENFQKLNEWAALAYQDPGRLALRIGEELKNQKGKGQAQLWVNTQLSRFEKQFNLRIHDHNDSDGILKPFWTLFYTTEAIKAQLFKRGAEAVQSAAAKIDSDLTDWEVTGNTITLPVRGELAKAINERTNRKINNVQRVVSLLIGIDNHESHPLKGCVYGANQIASFLQKLGKQKEFETQSVQMLLDKDATRLAILAALQNLFAAANPEDICLIYFAGHGHNRDLSENWIFPVEKEKQNRITNEDFLAAFQTAKAAKRCKTVFILDSHTGYYKWVNDDDVFLGAVRHTIQLERIYNGYVSSTFLAALYSLLELTKGKLTYRHLLLCLRFLTRTLSNQEKEVPVLMTSIANLDNYFLQTTKSNRDDAPLVTYNPNTDVWELLDEDFKTVPLFATTYLHHYVSDEPLPVVKGEIIPEGDRLLFNGITGDLNKAALYRADVNRPMLPVKFIQTSPGQTEEQLFQATQFDIFSKWSGLSLLPDPTLALVEHPLNLHESEALLVDTTNGGYRVSFQPAQNDHQTSIRLEWQFGDRQMLNDFVFKFVRFNYLSNLTLPGSDYKTFASLNVSLKYRWQSGNRDDFHYLGPTVERSDLAFRIKDGLIQFNDLQLQITNDEGFPVFYDLYLLTSNLSIKPLKQSKSATLLPGASEEVLLHDTILFDAILSGVAWAQIKLLVSRDMMQYDFIQEGIAHL